MVVVYADSELLGYLTPHGVYLSMGGLDSAIGSMKGPSGAPVAHTYSPKQGMAPASLSFPNQGAAKQGIKSLGSKATFSPAPTANLSDDEEDNEMPAHEEEHASCPMCDGPGNLLGNLGSRAHYRCQHCGMGFSHDTDDDNRAHFSELSAEDRKKLSDKSIDKPIKKKAVKPKLSDAKLSDSVSPSDADQSSADDGMDMGEDDCYMGEEGKGTNRPQDKDKTIRFFKDGEGDFHTKLGENWNITMNGKTKRDPKTFKMSEKMNPEFKRGLKEVDLSEVPRGIVSAHRASWMEKRGHSEEDARPSEDRQPGSQKVTVAPGAELLAPGYKKPSDEEVLRRRAADKHDYKLSEESLRKAGYSDADLAWLELDPKASAANAAVELSEKTKTTVKAETKTKSQYDPGLVNTESGPIPGTMMACPECGTERKPKHSFGGFTRVECPNCGQQDYVYNHDATGLDQGYEPIGEYTNASDGVGKKKNPDTKKFATLTQSDKDNK